MEILQRGNKIELRGVKNFHIPDVLECGQCFRFEKLGNMQYCLVALDKVLFAEQNADGLLFWYPNKPLAMTEFNDLWLPYFDLNRDYNAILTKICENDPVMTAAAAFAPGIRLLQQEPWETIISFIISQNNRIPQIKKVVKNIARRYGSPIDEANHAFPTPSQLVLATEDGLRECKTGFRAGYIMDAAQKAALGHMPLNRDNTMPTAQLRQTLLDVRGIGEKVAHCILLFGYGRFDAFPVDTWVQKVMQQYYFDGKKATGADIHNFAAQRFGPYSGFAQQYLFHYIRMKSGENKNKQEILIEKRA